MHREGRKETKRMKATANGETILQVWAEGRGMRDRRLKERIKMHWTRDRETEQTKLVNTGRMRENRGEALGFTSRCEARWRTTMNTVPVNWEPISREKREGGSRLSFTTELREWEKGNGRGWGLTERETALSEWSRIITYRRKLLSESVGTRT